MFVWVVWPPELFEEVWVPVEPVTEFPPEEPCVVVSFEPVEAGGGVELTMNAIATPSTMPTTRRMTMKVMSIFCISIAAFGGGAPVMNTEFSVVEEILSRLRIAAVGERGLHTVII